jgi:hypothetical protein
MNTSFHTGKDMHSHLEVGPRSRHRSAPKTLQTLHILPLLTQCLSLEIMPDRWLRVSSPTPHPPASS